MDTSSPLCTNNTKSLRGSRKVICSYIFLGVGSEIEDEIIRFAAESPEPRVEDVEKYALAEDDPWVRGGD